MAALPLGARVRNDLQARLESIRTLEGEEGTVTDRLVRAWLVAIGEQTVPPFVVELVLINGSRYFLHSAPVVDEESGSAALRIWDFRAFSEEDFDTLKRRLNELVPRGGELPRREDLHPKLDWAILRINLDQIAYCVEWHDRIWPEERRPQVGFSQPQGHAPGAAPRPARGRAVVRPSRET